MYAFTVPSPRYSRAAISGLDSPAPTRPSNLALARAECLHASPHLRLPDEPPAAVGPAEPFDHAPGDPGRQEGPAARHRPYAREEFVPVAGLQQGAAGAAGRRPCHVGAFGERGEDGDGRAGDGADDLLGGHEPVQAGHADVGRGHVGAVHAGRLDGLASVAPLGDDLNLAAAVQKGAHPGPAPSPRRRPAGPGPSRGLLMGGVRSAARARDDVLGGQTALVVEAEAVVVGGDEQFAARAVVAAVGALGRAGARSVGGAWIRRSGRSSGERRAGAEGGVGGGSEDRVRLGVRVPAGRRRDQGDARARGHPQRGRRSAAGAGEGRGGRMGRR